jgi:uncharacterized MnhB-related membrane protein
MIVFAIIALQTRILRNAIIYSGVFSLLCSFAYLLYKAPDVAIAEAVIGCTLSTILYLVALKKYRIFRVYYANYNDSDKEKNRIIAVLDKFASYIELQLDVINTRRSVEEIISSMSYDVIIEQHYGEIIIYGSASNYHFDSLIEYFKAHSSLLVKFQYIDNTEDEEME